MHSKRYPVSTLVLYFDRTASTMRVAASHDMRTCRITTVDDVYVSVLFCTINS